jgi:PAS domain-containing protein
MSQTARESFFKTIIDAFPSPVLIVDRDIRILAYNAAGARMLDAEPELIRKERAGEILHCVNSTATPGGCGSSSSCRLCVVRNSVGKSFQGRKVVRERTKMEVLGSDGRTMERYLMVTASLFGYEDQDLVLLIIEDISELLKAMLPICCHCKKIRSGAEHWHSLEDYFLEHHNIEFSHGICPHCARKHYPEIFQKSKTEKI